MIAKPDRRTAHWHRKAAAERAKGKVRRHVWCYRDDWPEIQATAERLTERREATMTDHPTMSDEQRQQHPTLKPMPKAEHEAQHRREKEQSDE